jgi:ribosomal protein S13
MSASRIDSLEWIGHKRHLIVKKDQLEQVDENKHMLVKKDQIEKIEGDLHETVVGDRMQAIKGDQNLKVIGDRKEAIAKDDNLKVTGNLNVKTSQTLSHERRHGCLPQGRHEYRRPVRYGHPRQGRGESGPGRARPT